MPRRLCNFSSTKPARPELSADQSARSPVPKAYDQDNAEQQQQDGKQIDLTTANALSRLDRISHVDSRT